MKANPNRAQLEQAIPVFKPLLEKEELAASSAALENGWLGMGANVHQFEEAAKAFLKLEDRHVAAVSTGHAAIHLCLLLAGVGPGDEVITPSFNNIADFQAVMATGADIVFCDIDDKSLCVDLNQAESLITPRTKLLIVMDYGVHLCDHDRVADLAQKYDLRVLHDAAHSFGSRYKGRSIGSFSDMTIFSFDPIKTITCIDGGLVVVKTKEELERLHEMRLIGMGQPASVMYQNKRAWTYNVKRLGFRYHLANLHAAIGLAQLAKIDKIVSTRRQTCRMYNEALGELPGVVTPKTDFETVAPFLYYIRVPADRRDDFRKHLGQRSIDTGIHWQPGHWFTLFKDCRRGNLSVTEQVGGEIVTLPLHSSMSGALIERVIEGVVDFFS